MRLLAVIFCAGLTFACGSGADYSEESFATPASTPPRSACDADTSRLVGHLYYMANPVNEQLEFQALERFVSDNSQHLAANTRFAACAASAGASLKSIGFASFDAQAGDAAYASAMGSGATIEQAQSVQSSINRGSIQVSSMGDELSWLADVIPSAAAGNWDPFRSEPSTIARGMIRQAWPQYELLFQLDPSARGIFQSVLAQYQPWLEYQVAFIVAQTK